jgi:hypothetical protein
MAVYKVPQDVEAEDKLLGPFSFRQFIYLMVAGGAGFVAFLLFQVSPFLAAIPLPIIFLFGALALPLRKDQPMETYLIAIVRFLLKPRKRLWNPDGTITYVEITAPKVVEQQLTKTFSEGTAEERLDYLARVMDSRGWALKGVNKAEVAVAPGVADEAANAFDILDDHADLAKSFDDMLAKKNQQHRQAALASMQKPAAPPLQTTTPFNDPSGVLRQQFAAPAAVNEPTVAPRFNPYPTIHQKVIQPAGNAPAQAPTPPPTPVAQKTDDNKAASAMTAQVSPDIMRLANNNDLSISAIAHEAHRLQEGDEGEVVISLH